jgi:twinkle protein
LNQKVCLFFLEQQPEETAKRLAGKVAGRRFHIPRLADKPNVELPPDYTPEWTDEELSAAIDTLDTNPNITFFDSFGANQWDVIRDTIRFMAHAEGVRIFYLDHLTALAAAEDDERKGLERITAEMGSLVKELDIMLIMISHLATPEGKPHEEGGRVMIRHFKGSRAIGFWCHYMFGLERDQQHENPAMRSISTFRVLKDRYTGNSTGKVIYLGYDINTGQLFETELPDEEEGAALGFTNEEDDEIPF